MSDSTTNTTDSSFLDLLREHNLYLIPAGPQYEWYAGNWDADWGARDEEAMGSMGAYGKTPELAIKNYLNKTETP